MIQTCGPLLNRLAFSSKESCENSSMCTEEGCTVALTLMFDLAAPHGSVEEVGEEKEHVKRPTEWLMLLSRMCFLG